MAATTPPRPRREIRTKINNPMTETRADESGRAADGAKATDGAHAADRADALKTLRLERSGAVLSVVLNRPHVHDVFDDVMIGELTRVFRSAATDQEDARVIVLRSAGKHFCAGADLNWMRRMADYSEDENREDARALEAMFRAIATCPKPVVVRVQGAALGGGSGLVAAADIAVASTRASFAFTEARLGILPAMIGPYVLRKLHPGQAQALFLTGSRFRADRALQIGLVQQVVEPDDPDEAVDVIVNELLACSPEAQARIKRLVPAIAHAALEQAASATVDEITQARASRDGKEGMAAFLEKRPAPWTVD